MNELSHLPLSPCCEVTQQSQIGMKRFSSEATQDHCDDKNMNPVCVKAAKPLSLMSTIRVLPAELNLTLHFIVCVFETNTEDNMNRICEIN